MRALAEVERARELYAQRAWRNAHAALSSADGLAPLGADDLERLATAAYMIGRQDEYFEVLEGTVTTIIDGVETSHAVGETFHVPAGTVHQMVGEAGARLNWQVRPALRTAEFFEGLYTGTAAARRGEEFDLGAFLASHTAEVRFP